MRRLLLTLFSLTFALNISAQSINLHTTPVASYDYSPRWRMGIEYNTENRLSYSLDVGYGNYTLNKFRVNGLKWGEDYNFFEARPEVKYYFPQNRTGKIYAGIELLFLQLNNTFTNISLDNVAYEEAIFHKRKFGGHFKTGTTYYIGRLLVELSGGIGLAHRNRYYTDIVNPQPIYYYDSRENWGDGHKKVGKSIIWHFTYNLKIGFVLWQKEN